MTAINISIALVTRNRPDSLRRCLSSWRAQTLQPFEIVVSDDSEDAIRLEIQGIAQEFLARYIPGPRRGLYANRNHVAGHCLGTHVFSADDDHEHPSDFLEKCMEAVKQHPDSIWCLGEADSWSGVSKGLIMPGELRLHGASDFPEDFDNTWAWSDGAALCPRRIYSSGLVFSESFRFGATYLEFGCLLHYLGERIRILQTTGVIHHCREVGRSFQIPVEETAARYFAVLMLALVYQASAKNLALLAIFFLKELARRPGCFVKAFCWSCRATRDRVRWLRKWQAGSAHV